MIQDVTKVQIINELLQNFDRKFQDFNTFRAFLPQKTRRKTAPSKENRKK
jgi:hypothetical protein